MNAAARETQAAGTLEAICTGHAGTHASRLSLRRQAGTSMYEPCICTVSEDMRMGRDARMSHVQDASTAAFGEYSTTIAAQEASEAPVPQPHCHLAGVRVI